MSEEQTAVQAETMPEPRLPGINELLSEAWKVFTIRFKSLLATYLWQIVLFLLAIVPAAILLIAGYALGYRSLEDLGAVEWVVMVLVGLFTMIALVYVQIWTQVALIVNILKRDTGVTYKESYKQGRLFVGPYFWTSFLTAVLVLGGLVLLIVPGILLALWTIFASVIVVAENRKGMDAIVASREYMRGLAGKIIGRIIIVGLVCFAVFFGATAIISVIPMDENILNLISQILWIPLEIFMSVYFVLLYEKVKAIKGQVPPTDKKMKRKYAWIAIAGVVLVPLLVVVATVISNMKQ
jgi:hypothetical protein